MATSVTKNYSSTFLIVSLLLIWLGFGIRLHYLGHDSFWFDEVLTVNAAKGGIESSLKEVHHPPLHYLFVSAAIKLFNENEFAARLPSAFVGTLTLPLLMVWGKLIGRNPIGLWAAFFLALSPLHLRYSQEARHYAWLTLFSLASYIFLYLAFRKNDWRWWIFYSLVSVLNLYTHFAALVVLATQGIMIAGWIAVQWRNLRYQALMRPGVSALIVFVLYIPGLSKLLFALNYNLGEDAIRGSHIDMTTSWLQKLLFEFSPDLGILPYVMILLLLLGMVVIARAGNWWLLLIIAGGIVLPIFLISVFKVSRWALVKYIIYIFPLYLMAVGIALDAILKSIKSSTGKNGRYIYAFGSLLIVILWAWLTWPFLQDEYQFVERDWEGLAEYLKQETPETEIIVTTTLDMVNGFDAGILMLPYYMNREAAPQTILSVHELNQEKLDQIAQTDAKLRLAVLNRGKMDLEDETIEIVPFQGSLFLLSMSEPPELVLDQLIYLYEQVFPLAAKPLPRCFLSQDLALFYSLKQDYLTANQLFSNTKAQCPQRFNNQYGGYDLAGNIYRGLIDHYKQQGDIQEARHVAAQLLQLNAKDTKALETLTAVDLLKQFEAGAVQVTSKQDVEPIQVRRFTMPQNGDWGDVILIHPPNSLSFKIELPEEEVELRSRIAMAPESWEWGGDGSTFIVYEESDINTPTKLFSQYISNDAKDRNWQEIVVPLSEYAGQTITLTLTVEPGPNNDFTGDWAGWETPRIMYQSGSE